MCWQIAQRQWPLTATRKQLRNRVAERVTMTKPEQMFTKKIAKYPPHTLAPRKSMSRKVITKFSDIIPLTDVSHLSTHHSHKFFSSYHPARLSIDSLIRVCQSSTYIPHFQDRETCKVQIQAKFATMSCQGKMPCATWSNCIWTTVIDCWQLRHCKSGMNGDCK